MEYRIANEADIDSVRRLWAYSFNGDEPFASWYFANFYDPNNALGCWRDGRLQAVLHMHPYKLFLRGKEFDASYIVGVATDPTARRAGLTGALLAETLAEMKRRNRPVSILMPFKAGFYYPYDWRLCHHHLKYTVQLEDLRPVAKPRGEFRPADAAEFTALDAVYRSFVSNYHGYVMRCPLDWEHIISEHTNDQGYVYLLEVDRKPSGYIMYLVRNGKISVREMAYCDIQSQQALFDFLYGHRSHAQSVEWNAPLDIADKVLFSLFEAKQDIRVFPFMAARLADVRQALNHCSYPEGNWSVDIAVSDNLASWNNRTFKLRVNNGQAIAEKSDSAAQVSLSVGALTQLVFGRLTAEELVCHGELFGASTGIDTLARLFPRCSNFINEYY